MGEEHNDGTIKGREKSRELIKLQGKVDSKSGQRGEKEIRM